MSVKICKIIVAIYIWEFIDWVNIDNIKRQWVLGIFSKKSWLQKVSKNDLINSEKIVIDAINDILENDTRFTDIQWSNEDLMEKTSI